MVLRSDRMVVGFTSVGICSLHLINVCIKKMQIAIPLFKKWLTIYDLRVLTTTLNFAITFYRKSYILFISETVITLTSTFTYTFSTYDL
jgi:hypothetical protein